MQLLLYQLVGKFRKALPIYFVKKHVWREPQCQHQLLGHFQGKTQQFDVYSSTKKFQDISRTSGISRTLGHPAFWFTTQEPKVFQIYAGTK